MNLDLIKTEYCKNNYSDLIVVEQGKNINSDLIENKISKKKLGAYMG